MVSRSRRVRLGASLAFAAILGAVFLLLRDDVVRTWLFGTDKPLVESLNAVAGVASLVIAVVALLQTRPRAARHTSPSFAADASDFLDALTRDSLSPAWEREWRARRLDDPLPLDVAWEGADELADRWDNIGGARLAGPPPSLDGTWECLADTFRAIPSRRLVVIGAGGRGKSVLCLHLARELAAAREPGGAVPVILPLATWDPEAEGLEEWMGRRLPIDVAPALAADAGNGEDTATALVRHGALIPILDGLDELPPDVHGRAIARINEAGRGPLVLTCREDAFTRATTWDAVTAAAVIRVRPLALGAVSTWLERTGPARGPLSAAWREVLAETGERASPAASALSTPLTVSLARAIYGESGIDPRELKDARDDKAVQGRLVARLVPVAYRDEVGEDGGCRPERYLRHLSRYVSDSGNGRFEWWQLRDHLPTWMVRAAEVAAVLTVSSACGWALGRTFDNRIFAVGFVATISVLALLLLQPLRRGRGPVAVRLGLRPRVWEAAVALRRPALGGLVLGVVFGVVWVAGWVVVSRVPLVPGLALLIVPGVCAAIGASLGSVLAIPFALTTAFSRPLALDRLPGPHAVLRLDRRWSIVRALAFGILAALTLPPTLTAAMSVILVAVGGANSMTVIRADLWFVVSAGPALALAFLLSSTAWGRFVLARSLLAARGRLPWRLMGFLDDARSRGVLRQSGSAYVFRHDHLRAHLAGESERAGSARVPRPRAGGTASSTDVTSPAT